MICDEKSGTKEHEHPLERRGEHGNRIRRRIGRLWNDIQEVAGEMSERLGNTLSVVCYFPPLAFPLFFPAERFWSGDEFQATAKAVTGFLFFFSLLG